MSYLARLVQETGLAARGAPPVTWPDPSHEAGGIVEIDETVEVAPPPAIPPPAPTPQQIARAMEVPESPSPPVAAAPEVSHEASVAPTDGPAAETARKEEPLSQRPPRLETVEDYVVRSLRTIEDVRRWVAAGPAGPAIAGFGTEEAPPEAHDLTFGPVTGHEPGPTPRLEVAPHPHVSVERSPDVQNVTLRIGRIDVTVEAPEAPAAPGRAPQAAPAVEAMPDTAAQRLRRHYVNWPGRF